MAMVDVSVGCDSSLASNSTAHPAEISEFEKKVIPTEPEGSFARKILQTRILETSNEEVEIIRKDPTSPFFSITSFEEFNLRPELLKGVYEMGFHQPSRIQEVALPLLLRDPPEDLVAQSQSGTGKTATFLLTMLSRVDPSKMYPQALCLAPTYELAIQTGEVLKALGKYCPEISIAHAVKRGIGPNVPTKENITQSHIIIGTPGTVQDCAFRSKTFDLKKISVFVLDEADVMISDKVFLDISLRIYRTLSPECQKILFSATYDVDVLKFIDELVPQATIMYLDTDQQNLENVKQFFISCPNLDEKYQAMLNIYGSVTVGRSVVFCQKKATAAWLAKKLQQDKCSVALVSGELEPSQRKIILNRFRGSGEKMIITTNVMMARGIDVDHVNLVVNYDLPVDMFGGPDYHTYIHRIGRTGRFGKMGTVVNLVMGTKDEHILKNIQEHFNVEIQRLNCDNL